MTTLLICSGIALLADVVLFSVLYYCVVLVRVSDAGGQVKGDALFHFFGPLRYIPRYFKLLSAQENSRWYNIFIKNWLVIQSLLFVVFVALLALS